MKNLSGLRTHGESRGSNKTPEYVAWRGMITRCCYPNCRAYRWYGARGITVAPEWRDSFETFLRDVGRKPPGTSIDRIDNSKNYEPGNVRWSTQTDQMRNSRKAKLLTFKGQTRCIAEWSEVTGLPRFAIYHRIAAGWSVDRALTAPLDRHPKGEIAAPPLLTEASA